MWAAGSAIAHAPRRLSCSASRKATSSASARSASEQRRHDPGTCGVTLDARTRDDGIHFAGKFADALGRCRRKAAVVGFGQRQRPSPRALPSRAARAALSHGRDAQLARAGAHRGRRREQRRAGHLPAAGDDQDAPLRLLVAVDRPAAAGVARSADRVERLRASPRARHRVGRGGLGRTLRFSGAPWFHSSSVGHAHAFWHGLEIDKRRCRN